MKTVGNQGRQGDVLVTRIEALPGVCAERPMAGDRVVIAHGEVTGHSHAMPSTGVRMLHHQGRMFVEVTGAQPQPLFHEEHETLLLGPGLYAIRLQRQYSDRINDWVGRHGAD